MLRCEHNNAQTVYSTIYSYMMKMKQLITFCWKPSIIRETVLLLYILTSNACKINWWFPRFKISRFLSLSSFYNHYTVIYHVQFCAKDRHDYGAFPKCPSYDRTNRKFYVQNFFSRDADRNCRMRIDFLLELIETYRPIIGSRPSLYWAAYPNGHNHCFVRPRVYRGSVKGWFSGRRS